MTTPTRQLARHAPPWLTDEAKAELFGSEEVAAAMAGITGDPACPASVRRVLEATATEPVVDGVVSPDVWELCLSDTGVWPRLVIAKAREMGGDPLSDPDQATAGHDFWTALLFTHPDDAPIAEPEEAGDIRPESEASDRGPAEEDPAVAVEQPDAGTASGGAETGLASLVERLAPPAKAWADHARRRAEIEIELGRIDEELGIAAGEARGVLEDWVVAQTAASRRDLDDAARDASARSEDAELVRLSDELRGLRETREDALAHTHAAVRDGLAEMYDAKAAQLTAALEARRGELTRVDSDRSSITVGAVWTTGSAVVVALLPLLDGAIEGAAATALSEIVASNSDVSLTEVDEAGRRLVLDVGAAAVANDVAVALPASMTDALTDVAGWPEGAVATLVVLAEPASSALGSWA